MKPAGASVITGENVIRLTIPYIRKKNNNKATK
jgi:hypothetical protein